MANSQDTTDPNDASNPRPSMGFPRPPSVGGISSRVTDMASEDGENSSTQPAQSQRSVSYRGPPPARSSIAAPSQITTHITSRPGSSASRLSRTHIPSLTAQGFFRPMSSQRLQAHRGRPMTKSTMVSSEDWDQSSQNRRSLISNGTFGQASSGPVEQEVPPSRGTEYTDPIIPDRGTSTASPTGQTTVRSLGENTNLLHDRDSRYKAAPSHLNLGVNYTGNGAQDPPQRSPLSFLSLQNRNGHGHEHRDSRGHERLSSAASSPEPIDMKKSRATNNSSLGKNYEYFLGNTVFWGGGRFQNSRSKPINIATGLLVVVPSALFFGFSYVFFRPVLFLR